MRRFRTLVVVVVVAALVTASCSGGSSSPDAAGSPVDASGPQPTTASSDEEAEAAAVAEEAIASFDPDDIDASLAEAKDLDRRADLALAELEGITAELGGAEATAAAFAAADASVAGLTDVLQTPVVFGIRRQQQAEPDISMGLFGGLMTVALGSEGLVSSTNDGRTGTGSLAEGVTVTATADSVELAVDVTHDENGLTTTLKTKVKIFPCPDANGQFVVEAAVDTSSTVTGGTKSQRGTLNVKVTGQVDDNAELASTSSEFRLKRTGLGWGSFVDTSFRMNSDGSASSTLEDFNWFTTTSEQMKENASSAAGLGLLIQHFLLEAVVDGFQSGRCVRLAYDVSPGTTLEPSGTATIVARPRAKQDGAPTGGTVTAQLASGGRAVEPASTPLPADAEFTYTASDTVGDRATVALEARSRRGVGKANVDFTVSSTTYSASGSDQGGSFSGTVADLSQPFTLQYTGLISGAGEFTPTDARSGTFTFSVSGGGVGGGGGGNYTITPDDANGTLVLTAVTGACSANTNCSPTTQTIILTPISGP